MCLVVLLIGLMIQTGRKGLQLFRKENKLIALRKDVTEKLLTKPPSTTDRGEVELREFEEREIIKYEKGYFVNTDSKLSGEIEVAPQTPQSAYSDFFKDNEVVASVTASQTKKTHLDVKIEK
jgi:hypothetical protein